MDFINRSIDFDRVISSINDFDVTYLLAGKAFGLTSFINELSNRMTNYRVFVLNTINDVSVSKLFISDIIHSDDRNEFKKIVDQELGEKSSSLLSAILQCIPYVGPGFAYFADGKSLSPIYSGNYTSAIEEVLVPYIKKYTNKKQILVLIDEAQNMSEDSYNLVANIAQINGVKIVLGITNTVSSDFIKLKNSLSLYSNLEWNSVLFGQPENKLIKELANYLGLTFSNEKIEELLYSTQRNIHLIIDYMLNVTLEDNYNSPFNEIDKAIISFLFICKFGLTKPILSSMINLSNVYSPNINNDIDLSLKQLQNRGCIANKKMGTVDVFYLVSVYHPEVNNCISDFSDMLYHKNIVFDYYRRPGMHNEQEVLELLYELSLEFSDKCVKEYAYKILENKLKNGEKISDDIIANARLSKKVNKDIELSVLYYTRERHYNEALKWIESIKGKQSNTNYQILKGVLLNRVRKFHEAEETLTQAINKANEPRVINTLLAYYTANCIHTDQKDKAIYEYNSRKSELCGTENWGYFLRNLSSAVPFPDKKHHLLDAIDNFSLFGDNYGIYSSKCNWGNALCTLKNPAEGLILLKEAEVGLQQLGPNHLHIVYNDLGVCYLMIGDIKNAIKYISLAEKLALNRMPRLMTQISKACLQAVIGEYNSSKKILDNIQEEILLHPVLSIKQKYFTNRLLVEYMMDPSSYNLLCLNHEYYINRFVKQDIIQHYQELFSKGKQIKYKTKEWVDLFNPPGLAYWYVDPLKMI